MSDEKNPQELESLDKEKSTEDGDYNLQTTRLTMPDDASPMSERLFDPNTSVLSLGWRIQFRIGDQRKTIPVKPRIMVGREAETGANGDTLNFDLTPFGAYHFGVSRNHAVMTLDNGYLYLEDLGSTNGTRINGFQLTAKQKYRLRDGDEIEFARLRSNIIFKDPETL